MTAPRWPNCAGTRSGTLAGALTHAMAPAIMNGAGRGAGGNVEDNLSRDYIADILDYVVGWCSPQDWIWNECQKGKCQLPVYRAVRPERETACDDRIYQKR